MNIVVHLTGLNGPICGSMGGERAALAISKGLIELGHNVKMMTGKDTKQEDVDVPVVYEMPNDTDIIFGNGADLSKYNKPWLSWVHGGGSDPPNSHWHNNPNYLCVSQYICNLSNNKNYVHTCIYPDDFIYKDKKQNYIGWIAGTDWGEGKGLFTTIQLAKKLKFRLKLAGAGKNQQIINTVKSLCDDKIEFIGEVNGKEKAEFLSNAKAIILYSRLNDACPLVISESLISGTPVIGSMDGALPELIQHNKTGILCSNENELPKAVLNINKIKPIDCREYALEHFSHIATAKKLLKIFEEMKK